MRVVALLFLVAGTFVLLTFTLPESEDSGGGQPAATVDATVVERTETVFSEIEPGDGERPDVSRFTLASEAVGENLPVSVLTPPQAASRRDQPLLVFLHGAGGSDESSVNDRALLEAIEHLGARAPVIAFPDGGMSWWRKRPDGDWGRYVVREVIPAVARRFGIDRRRVAIGGISMGGFGAYHLGIRYPRRFCAVGGHSAGLYLSFEAASFGAFDNPADFRRNNVISTVRKNPEAFGGARIWNDVGDEDWFVKGNAAFVAALERGDADLTAHVWPGGHDGLYWSQHWPDYLRFYSRALANCDR